MAEQDSLPIPPGNAHVGGGGLPGAVHRAPHHRHGDGLGDGFQPLLHRLGQGDQVNFGPSAGGAGDEVRPLPAQADGLEDVPGGVDLLHRVGGEGHPEGVPNPQGQLLTTLAFGCSIDFSMGLLDWFIPGSALEQWLACLLSIVVLALGVFLEVRAKIFLVAGEGVVSVLAFVTQKKFSLIKNCFDISLVTLAIIISWVEFGTLQGVGAGTVVAAVLVGRFVHLYESRLSFFDRWKVEA